MNINVHIERLILEGLPPSATDGALIQAAIETELTGLLAEQGMSQSFGAAIPKLFANSIQVARDSGPRQLGHQVAGAIHGTLTPTSASRHETHSPESPLR